MNAAKRNEERTKWIFVLDENRIKRVRVAREEGKKKLSAPKVRHIHTPIADNQAREEKCFSFYFVYLEQLVEVHQSCKWTSERGTNEIKIVKDRKRFSPKGRLCVPNTANLLFFSSTSFRLIKFSSRVQFVFFSSFIFASALLCSVWIAVVRETNRTTETRNSEQERRNWEKNNIFVIFAFEFGFIVVRSRCSFFNWYRKRANVLYRQI